MLTKTGDGEDSTNTNTVRQIEEIPAVDNHLQTNAIQSLYNTVEKANGKLGGNASGGPIYGELTIGSMQKLIQVMMDHTSLSQNSHFIDIGCGLGKPCLHIAQQVGVEFSYGIEVERVHYFLGINSLKHVLKAAMLDARNKTNSEEKLCVSACFFALGDISESTSLDLFTHVYMFDIG